MFLGDELACAVDDERAKIGRDTLESDVELFHPPFVLAEITKFLLTAPRSYALA